MTTAEIQKKLKNKFKNKIYDRIEVGVLYCTDVNGTPYFYVHIKDYSDGDCWDKALDNMYFFLKDLKCKFANIDCGERKQLYWIPKDQNVKFLKEDGEEYLVATVE